MTPHDQDMAELVQSLRDRLERCHIEATEQSRLIGDLRRDLAEAHDALMAVVAERDTLTASVTEYQQQIGCLAEDVRHAEANLTRCQDVKRIVAAERDTARAELERARAVLASLDCDHDGPECVHEAMAERLRGQLRDTRAELAKADQENNDAGERALKAEAERDALRHEFEEMEKLHDAKFQDWLRAEAERDAQRQRAEQAEAERDHELKRFNQYREWAQEVVAERDAAHTAITRVRELRDQWALANTAATEPLGSPGRARVYADVVAWLDAALDALTAPESPQDAPNPPDPPGHTNPTPGDRP